MILDLEVSRWVRRFEWHLDQLPGILEVLRADSSGLKAARLSERVSGGGGPARLPFNVDLVDTTDDLWAAVIEYTSEVAERLGETVTDAVTWRRSGAAVGLSSAVTGYQARVLAFAVVRWLTERSEEISGLPMNDAEDHLFGMIRRLRVQYMLPPVERPSRRRTCEACGERAVAAEWVSDALGRGVLVVECRDCGESYDTEARGA
ncbi:hypothetical protein [Microbacterium sp. NPDC089696]|uniref:hypothetical protein n=1 Tax=Microbacterium sp. NPDC089696 TaxID=3364199 RepID=UPI0037F45C97